MPNATEIKQNILALTGDPEQRAKLARKLVEYGGRYGHLAPEVDPAGTYRYRLLSALLEKQIVDLDEFEASFRRFDWHRPKAFAEAVAIIKAYNSGDLHQVYQGTGLK